MHNIQLLMWTYFRTLIIYIGALGIVVGAFLVLINIRELPSSSTTDTSQAEIIQTASVSRGYPDPPPPSTTKDINQEKHVSAPEETETVEERILSVSSPTPNTEQATVYVSRIPNPYPFPQQSFLTTHEETLAALVNILCTTDEMALRPVSGSGIIIDPRGVILTNAHVAQYVLLAESGETSLSCFIRSGAPARVLWEAEVLYIPPVWVHEHAADITNTSPTGTGEHDYALLRITGSWEGPTPGAVPIGVSALPLDTREGIAFQSDLVLAASYPAEFVGAAAQFGLYPVSSIATVKELLTFESNTVDLISLGGVVGAQSGSSGGPVVNAWGRLIGIITTTSEGITTAERDLRAITLGYINRDLRTQTGLDLTTILDGDVAALAAKFRAKQAPDLIQTLIDEIAKRTR